MNLGRLAGLQSRMSRAPIAITADGPMPNAAPNHRKHVGDHSGA